MGNTDFGTKPVKKHPGKDKNHPYRRRFRPERIESSLGQVSSTDHSKIDSSEWNREVVSQSQKTKTQIAGWFRITIFECSIGSNRTYQLGTIYGRNIEILSGQLANLLKKKWLIADAVRLSCCSADQILECISGDASELTFKFEAPGSSNHRAMGQFFGAFHRSVLQKLGGA